MPYVRTLVRVRRTWWQRNWAPTLSAAAVVLVMASSVVVGLLAGGPDQTLLVTHPSSSVPATFDPEPSPTPTPPPKERAADLLGSEPLLWDGFARDDSDEDVGGTRAPSGQEYETSHSGSSSYVVRGGRLVPMGVVASEKAIVYTTLPGAHAVAVKWEWTGGRSGPQDVVVGASRDGFGRGSLQLAVYAGAWPRHEPLRWELFYVPNPIVEPYPDIASGPLPVVPGRQRLVLRRTGPSEVTVTLPDGSSRRVSDPAVAAWWGDQLGWQLRRPFGSDGGAEFTLLAAN